MHVSLLLNVYAEKYEIDSHYSQSLHRSTFPFERSMNGEPTLSER